MPRSLLAVLLLLPLAVPALAAEPEEDVAALLSEAKARYEAGERTAVLGLLERASGAIRRELGALLAARLPDAAAGFEGGPADVQFPQVPGAPVGVVVKRSYAAGGARIEVEIYRDAPFAQAMVGFASMAALLSGQPGVRRTRIGGQEMVWLWKEQERGAEGVLSVGTTVLVVRGHGLDGPATFDTFLRELAPVFEPLP